MKAKKKDLLKRIEALEKSVMILMDIQDKTALKALEHFHFPYNDLNWEDNEFFDRISKLMVACVDCDSVEYEDLTQANQPQEVMEDANS